MSTIERITVRVRPKSSAAFVAHAGSVAEYFGFSPARELDSRERSFNFHKAAALADGRARPGEPVLAYYASASPAHLPHEARAAAKPSELAEFGLIISGSDEPIAEILLLRTLTTILGEWGMPPARVRLNAMGDRDSKARFARELSAYLRKHHERLDDDCRRQSAHDPAAAYRCPNAQCREVLAGGPRAMNFLSEKSRAHFREVLEHVEELSIPYELDDLLMGDERDSRILFALDAAGDALVGAFGGRYDDAKRGKPLAAASILFRKGGAAAASLAEVRKRPAPKVYFIQLGLRAKMQGLSVVDTLRRAGVPMRQSFDARSLAPQIAAAKAAGVSHLIIMGAREALDRTVIIRAIDHSTQSIVPLKELPRALRSLR